MDGVGNPLHYDNGTSYNMTWTMGNRLATVSKGSYNTSSYVYDSDGLRTEKTVVTSTGTSRTKYFWEGNVLQSETHENEGYSIIYVYDSDGQAVGFYYKAGTVTAFYRYVRNIFGDITHIINENCQIEAVYTYDSWGKLLSIKNGSETNITNSKTSIGYRNSLRYRGYYYDTETGFYYLQSRYYDPVVGRFINADGQLNGGLLGNNLFAYCGNNPVNRIDPTGEAWWHWAIGAAVVAACAVATVITCGGFAAAATAVCLVANGVAAATTASTIAAGAFIGSATVYGMAVLTAASTSNSVQEFNDQGNWGTVAATAGGAVLGGGSAYLSTRTPTTKVYRSVSDAEAQDIKATGQFNLIPRGMECKQFGFDFAETKQFGNLIGQNTIVRAEVPTNMLNQFYTGGVDTSIFRNGTLTVYGDQLDAFNQAISGTIRFMP